MSNLKNEVIEMQRIWPVAVLLIAAIFLISGATAFIVAVPPAEPEEERNIVQAAGDAGSFSTLLAAAQAAGLAETLQEGGPFTVFAPTDEAFAKLPEGTVEALLDDPETLRSILLYHVVGGEVESGQVVQLSSVSTLQGGELKVSAEDGVKVNDANVVAVDIQASNGVIHVIDTVLIPS
jgi:uncharacterized surface protein with fasciclin (FAS1) repeats